MNCAAVVLAAGAARRFGGGKLSVEFRGEPLLAHAVRAARAAPVQRVVLVCGADLGLHDWPGDWPGDWPATPPVAVLRTKSDALSASLRAGIAAVADCDAAFVFLGDMPLVPHGVAQQLADALGAGYAAVPQHSGRRGHPVLLAHRAFADIAKLSGDHGAGMLLRGRSDVTTVATDDAGVLRDVDTPADLAGLNRLQAL